MDPKPLAEGAVPCSELEFFPRKGFKGLVIRLLRVIFNQPLEAGDDRCGFENFRKVVFNGRRGDGRLRCNAGREALMGCKAWGINYFKNLSLHHFIGKLS